MLTEIISFLKKIFSNHARPSAAKSQEPLAPANQTVLGQSLINGLKVAVDSEQKRNSLPTTTETKEIQMITMSELLMGRSKLEDLPKEIQDNLADLLQKINIIRRAYGKPMKVNDGYRRAQDRPKNGSATSWHYQGAAVDIDDNDAGDFAKWVIANLKLVRDAGLYIEDVRWTNGCGSWVHFQTRPPRSGKRVFIPSTKPPCNPNLWDGKYDPALDK